MRTFVAPNGTNSIVSVGAVELKGECGGMPAWTEVVFSASEHIVQLAMRQYCVGGPARRHPWSARVDTLVRHEQDCYMIFLQLLEEERERKRNRERERNRNRERQRQRQRQRLCALASV